MFLQKTLSLAAWLALAVFLAVLSKEGLVSMGFAEWHSWLGAGGLTLLSSVFAGLFRRTSQPMYLVGIALAIAALTTFDGVNLIDVLRKANKAPTLVADAAAEAVKAEVESLKEEVRALESNITETQAAAEAETLGGKSGKPGIGPVYRGLIAKVESLRERCDGKRAELGKRQAELAAKRVDTVRSSTKEHILASVPEVWLFVGCGVLELLMALAAWGMEEPRKGHKPSAPAPQVIIQNINPTEKRREEEEECELDLGIPSRAGERVDENEPLSTELKRRAWRVSARCKKAGH